MAASTTPERPAPTPSPPALRAVNALLKGAGCLSAFLIVCVLAIVCYAIVQRYLLGTPLLWGDELIGYALVTIVMLGAAEALRRGDHITMDLFTARAGPRLARVLTLWSNLAVVAFAVVLGWSTWESIRFAIDFGSYAIGHIEIATWIPQLPMLLGCVLLGLAAVARIVSMFVDDGPR